MVRGRALVEKNEGKDAPFCLSQEMVGLLPLADQEVVASHLYSVQNSTAVLGQCFRTGAEKRHPRGILVVVLFASPVFLLSLHLPYLKLPLLLSPVATSREKYTVSW